MAFSIVRPGASDSIPVEELRRAFNYNPDTGSLAYRVDAGRWGRFKAGTEVGHIKKADGYLSVNFNRQTCVGHRLIWALMTGAWPRHMIDHINGDRADNRWCNLRPSDPFHNRQNQRKPSRNSLIGVLGVSHGSAVGSYRASITANGVKMKLGTFYSIEDAHQAYLDAKRRLHQGCTI